MTWGSHTYCLSGDSTNTHTCSHNGKAFLLQNYKPSYSLDQLLREGRWCPLATDFKGWGKGGKKTLWPFSFAAKAFPRNYARLLLPTDLIITGGLGIWFSKILLCLTIIRINDALKLTYHNLLLASKKQRSKTHLHADTPQIGSDKNEVWSTPDNQ